ncbi:MAG TPA: hypothetical protein PK718_01410 [Candidatus Methanofastidiosa archaeon]|nr:hypothetical protein [Candidatus Methanofastidiosa archaeon]
MIIFDYDIRINYLPLYLAVPIWIVLIIITGYLVWWLIHGTWTAIFFLMASLMMIVETWDRTRQEKREKMFSLRKLDPL